MTDLIIRGRKRLAEIRAHNGQAALNDGPAYDPDADLLEALLDALEEQRETIRLFEEEHIAWQETREGMNR